MVGNLKISIFTRIIFVLGFFFALFFATLFSTDFVNASFCNPNSTLTPVALFTQSGGTQGMCIAEDYCIQARTNSDSQKTEYAIYDLKTGTKSSFYYPTRHSNSLTYNKSRKEVVCVSDGVAYIFNFSNGQMSYKTTKYLKEHFVKVCCVDGIYYLSTGIQTYKTSDFLSMSRVFTGSEHGVNQGMGSDGKYLYICWYGSANTINVMTTGGSLIKSYVVPKSVCDEVEEIDFYNGNLYLNINNNGSANGIYVVSKNHNLTDWVTKQPTCVNRGYEERHCLNCDYEEKVYIPETGEHDYKIVKVIEPTCSKHGKIIKKCKVCKKRMVKKTDPTGEHIYSNWKITKDATCTENGLETCKCKVCKQVFSQVIPAKGHKFSKWILKTYPTEVIDGVSVRVCADCEQEEYNSIGKLTQRVIVNNSDVELTVLNRDFYLTADATSDIIWESDNTNVIEINDTGKLIPHKAGSATITATAKSARSETVEKAFDTCTVKVKWF